MTGNSSSANHSEQTLESLSAMVDNEATSFEERRLLSMTDEGLVSKWQSYQLTGAVMRREVKPLMKDLSASIADLIAAEAGVSEEPVAPKKSLPARGIQWRDWFAKSAIAASFAFALTAGVQLMQTDSLTGTATTDSVIAQQEFEPVVTAPAGFDLPAPVARNVSLGGFSEPTKLDTDSLPTQQFLSNAEVEAELQQLFLEHAELSAESGQFGLMPMARAAKMAPVR